MYLFYRRFGRDKQRSGAGRLRQNLANLKLTDHKHPAIVHTRVGGFKKEERARTRHKIQPLKINREIQKVHIPKFPMRELKEKTFNSHLRFYG